MENIASLKHCIVLKNRHCTHPSRVAFWMYFPNVFVIVFLFSDHSGVKYLKLQFKVFVLGNKTQVLRDLSGPSPLVNLHPWEKDRGQILFFCDFGENCVSESLFSSLRTILEVLTHTREWEVRFIAFLELKTYQKVQKQLRRRN